MYLPGMPLHRVGTSPFESALSSSMVATVTRADPVLSEAIPREADEIEALMAR